MSKKKLSMHNKYASKVWYPIMVCVTNLNLNSNAIVDNTLKLLPLDKPKKNYRIIKFYCQ